MSHKKQRDSSWWGDKSIKYNCGQCRRSELNFNQLWCYWHEKSVIATDTCGSFSYDYNKDVFNVQKEMVEKKD